MISRKDKSHQKKSEYYCNCIVQKHNHLSKKFTTPVEHTYLSKVVSCSSTKNYAEIKARLLYIIKCTSVKGFVITMLTVLKIKSVLAKHLQKKKEIN